MDYPNLIALHPIQPASTTRAAGRKRKNSHTKEGNQNTKDICKEKPLDIMCMSKRLESCLGERDEGRWGIRSTGAGLDG